jgi:hypothetical protein
MTRAAGLLLVPCDSLEVVIRGAELVAMQLSISETFLDLPGR